MHENPFDNLQLSKVLPILKSMERFDDVENLLFETAAYLQQIPPALIDNRSLCSLLEYVTTQFPEIASRGFVNFCIAYYQSYLELNPSDYRRYFELGNIWMELRQTDRAVASYKTALLLQPDDAEILFGLGNASMAQGESENAINYYRSAIAKDKNYHKPYLNLAYILSQKNLLPEAKSLLYTAVSIKSDFSEAYANLGAVLKELQQFDEAEACCLKALEIRPDYLTAYLNLGAVQQEKGNLVAAIKSFQKALRIDPNSFQARINLAIVYLQQRNYSQVISFCEELLVLDRNNTKLLSIAVEAFFASRLWLQGLEYCSRWIAIADEDALANFNMGFFLYWLERDSEAIVYLQRAIQYKKDYGDPYLVLQMVYRKMNQYRLRREILDRYCENCRSIDGIRSSSCRISAYVSSGLLRDDLEADLEILETSIIQKEASLTSCEATFLYEQFLFYLPHLRDDIERNTKLSSIVGRLYVRHILRDLPVISVRTFESRQRISHDLRIGIISSHFCRHAVGWCCGGMIVELSKITPHVFLYVTDTMKPDERTEVFATSSEKIYFPEDVGKTSHLLEEILGDRLDVLIDFDSLTVPENVRILYHRPAPLCISWIGFDAPFISPENYLLGDMHTRPLGVEAHYVEQLLRMPDSLVAVAGFACEPTSREARRQALDIPPEVTAYLSVAPGSKFSAELAEVHIHILSQVPNSVLIYKLLGDVEVIQSTYRHLCEAKGVDFQRLRSVGMETPEEKHRTIYLAADVLLDSYPMNGGTYTLEALWFELPVVTLVGQQYCSRMGYSFLKTLEIEVGLANHWEEYISWAVRLGLDRKLRLSVRDRLHAAKQPETLSPLWNPAKFARDLYGMLEKLLKQELNQNNPENPEDPENNGTR